MAGVVVIGLGYCNAVSTDILAHKPVLPNASYKFAITDTSGNRIFRVEGTSTALHKQQVLVDSYGNPLVTFRMKWRTMHKEWEAFRGASTHARDLIFTTKEPSIMDTDNVDLDVYLGNSDHVAYKVNNLFEFYEANSGLIIAKANEYSVTICPNVDIAFIASLIVILDGVRVQKAEGQTVVGVLFKLSRLHSLFASGVPIA